MKSNNREFPDHVSATRVYYTVRNEPKNEITGKFFSVAEAQVSAMPGDVIYEVVETTERRALMVSGS